MSDIHSLMRSWMDDAEHFIGEEMSYDKKIRLDRLESLCRRIAARDERIGHAFRPLDNRTRNGTVQLVFPGVIMIDDAETENMLSELYAAAEDVFIAAAEDGTIRMTFGVRDMWTKWGFDNDMEHGK